MLKRIIDVAGSLVACVFLSWVFLIIYLLVKVSSSGPALFTQQRAGRNGFPFRIYKFRTMQVGSDSKDRNIEIGDSRITPVGHVLRKWSLDELPQLFNVIKGDMSLVGPRPLPVDYSSRYNEQQAKRLDVRPGITGLQQVTARYDTPWEKKFEIDVDYVDNRNLWLDAKILLLTVWKVLNPPKSADSGGRTYEFKGEEATIED